MTAFDILRKDLPIHQNTMLEASAGTGKTFTIEHLVIRFLLEEDPRTQLTMELSEILIVTFTKKAVLDLKKRVRSALKRAISVLSQDHLEEMPDYLQALIDNCPDRISAYQNKLEKALSVFEEAEIFTIHSFSMKALMENSFETGFTQSGEKENITHEELMQVAEEFFRTEFSPPDFSRMQLTNLMRYFSSDIAALLKKLVNLANTYHSIEKKRSFKELYQELKRASTPANEEEMQQRLMALADYFKKPQLALDERTYRILSHALSSKEISEEDFDQLIKEGMGLAQQFSEENRKKKGMPKTPIDETLLGKLRKLLLLIEEAASPEVILVNAAALLKGFIKRRQEEEGKFSFDALLTKAWESAESARFKESIRSRYKAVIIDEFQDTDPMQWGIFYRLFIEGSSDTKIFLVGDPKQSIYHFRQADIYTYLRAADDINIGDRGTLGVNYRSRPELIEAINLFFDESKLPKLIALPKTRGHLPYLPVKAGRKEGAISFSDDKKAFHIILKDQEAGKEDITRLLIAEEIKALREESAVRFGQMAVLVKDRIQGKEVEEALEQELIPACWQRGYSLIGSLSHKAMIELLEGVILFKNFNKLKVALAGPILLFPQDAFEDVLSGKFLAAIQELGNLRDTLFNQGFASFFEELKSKTLSLEKSVSERLIALHGGSRFLDEVCTIAERLMEVESELGYSPDRLLHHLKEALSYTAEDYPEWNLPPSSEEDSVKIITIHSSKGLEYDIVFAAGLSKPGHTPEQIVHREEEGKFVIKALLSHENKLYEEWCEEIDAEKIRQLYVALTRAKERLYLYFPDLKKDRLALGKASPLDLWLAKLSVKEGSYQDLYSAIKAGTEEPLMRFLESQKVISYETGRLRKRPSLTLAADTPAYSLKEPPHIAREHRPIILTSFSSMTKESTEEKESGREEAPHDFNHPIKTALTLPSGPKTGVVIHSLLEKIPFNPQKAEAYIADYLSGSEYAPWTRAITQMVLNALTQNIFGFSLAEVNPSKIMREYEFLYPAKLSPSAEGFLKGVIDLIFHHQGKYYLLDWKTNWLGKELADYTEEKILRSMEEHHYKLQAKIYAEALKRYVRLFDDRPFEEIFGGAYYVYLRGLSSLDGTASGVAPVLFLNDLEAL